MSAKSDKYINLKRARKILGSAGKSYSDDDLVKIIDILYGIAEHHFMGDPSDD